MHMNMSIRQKGSRSKTFPPGRAHGAPLGERGSADGRGSPGALCARVRMGGMGAVESCGIHGVPMDPQGIVALAMKKWIKSGET